MTRDDGWSSRIEKRSPGGPLARHAATFLFSRSLGSRSGLIDFDFGRFFLDGEGFVFCIWFPFVSAPTLAVGQCRPRLFWLAASSLFFGSNKNQILFRFFFLLFLSGVFEDYEFWRADSFGLVDSLLIGGRAAARESLASPVVFLFLSTILWILTANRLCLVDRVWSAAKMCRGNLWRPPSLLLLGIDEDSWGFFQCWNRIFFLFLFVV